MDRLLDLRSPCRRLDRPRLVASALSDLENLGFRNLVVEEGLLDLLVLRHLAVDPLPPARTQGDPDRSPLLLEHDLGLRPGFEGDVPFAHRATAGELDAVEDAPHRRLGPARHARRQPFVTPEAALSDRAHSKAERDVDAQVAMEALKGNELGRYFHRSPRGITERRTFVSGRGVVSAFRGPPPKVPKPEKVVGAGWSVSAMSAPPSAAFQPRAA